MNLVITNDTDVRAGPGVHYRTLGVLPRGTIVRCVERRNGWVQLESGDFCEQAWMGEQFTQAVFMGNPVSALQVSHNQSMERVHPQAAVHSDNVTWSWGPRLVGGFQLVGGVLEIALGVGGVAVPEPATTVGGVILIAHGSDTVIAGFRTLWSGEISHTATQTGATIAARGLGASPQMAQRIGIGTDFVAGVGPSVGISVTRRLMIAGAERASHRVAVAYMHRSALQMGHNAVGVRTGSTTAWVHFAGVPQGVVTTMRGGPSAKYIVTELAVNGQQAARAINMQQTLMRTGIQTWRYMGPNCTTTALQVLKQGGVVVPAWSVSPGLLHLGVRAGPEVTFMAGAMGSTVPDLVSGGR